MTDTTLDDVERNLGRVEDLEQEEAISVLQTAKRDLEAMSTDGDVDEERRQALEDRLNQRMREIEERDAYDGNVGEAMNPEDHDAP
ncbi:hypothetical protein C491_01821 [Natronococcus amylolyticus DSM 10524]|uniref:Uncharacterized protein n=1 Tax=Natronococcus amylolyticus DSM 10524 TaxID=1227497 RepID=L9XJZ9_9EURY|nr:hypothetical protein [Natronococcus amylolyticus]ELY60963.1 hypothetical protein C491_01821 [Natronococcus amylolyticus DSM 10524]